MPDHPRSLALLAQVTRGLLRHGETRTAQHLGDRTAYVGLSDVGRAITCFRAAVASKLKSGGTTTDEDLGRWFQNGAYESIRDSLARQLILQRGDWLETGLDSALRAKCLSEKSLSRWNRL